MQANISDLVFKTPALPLTSRRLYHRTTGARSRVLQMSGDSDSSICGGSDSSASESSSPISGALAANDDESSNDIGVGDEVDEEQSALAESEPQRLYVRGGNLEFMYVDSKETLDDTASQDQEYYCYEDGQCRIFRPDQVILAAGRIYFQRDDGTYREDASMMEPGYAPEVFGQKQIITASSEPFNAMKTPGQPLRTGRLSDFPTPDELALHRLRHTVPAKGRLWDSATGNVSADDDSMAEGNTYGLLEYLKDMPTNRRENARDCLIYLADPCTKKTTTWAKAMTRFTGIRKLGDGSYSQVFEAQDNGRPVVLKLIAMKAQPTDLYSAASFKSVLEEYLITRSLASLDSDKANMGAMTPTFIALEGLVIARGLLPEPIEKAVHAHAEAHPQDDYAKEASEFVKRKMHRQDFALIALERGGVDLERFEFTSVAEAASVVAQIAFGLAAAEQALHFEHRDLHESNVLVQRLESENEMRFEVAGKRLRLTTRIQTKIIDYTFSRLSLPTSKLSTDRQRARLYHDVEPEMSWTGRLAKNVWKTHEHVYRMQRAVIKRANRRKKRREDHHQQQQQQEEAQSKRRRKTLRNKAHDGESAGGGHVDWRPFVPRTNVLWLTRLIEHVVHGLPKRLEKEELRSQLVEQLTPTMHMIRDKESCRQVVTDEDVRKELIRLLTEEKLEVTDAEQPTSSVAAAGGPPMMMTPPPDKASAQPFVAQELSHRERKRMRTR